MKIKLGDILNAKESFDSLIEKKISFKSNYRLSKLILEINKELETFEKTKTKIFQTYGEEIELEGKKQIRIKPENNELFSKEINNVFEEEVELKYEPMFIEDLVYYKDGKEEEDCISVKDMVILNKFFKSKDDIKEEKQDEKV